jgi:hypothetical protein
VAVERSHEACGHIVAEQRKLRAMGAVLDRQGTAGVAAVVRVPERGVEAEGDARQIEAIGLAGRLF